MNETWLREKCIKKIERDKRDFRTQPLDFIKARPIDHEDIFKWEASVKGPSDSPYEGGEFHFAIQFPPHYGIMPPRVRAITKIFHPNFSQTGGVCMGILTPHDWSPAYSLKFVLLSICSLLSEPNPYYPHPHEEPCRIAWLYIEDKTQFIFMATEATRLLARPDSHG
eukprot:gene57526-biopygen28506